MSIPANLIVPSITFFLCCFLPVVIYAVLLSKSAVVCTIEPDSLPLCCHRAHGPLWPESADSGR
uniref:Uncharacterized protein n=1 Tax=Anguilla anguilla TaxID=7936 RepID=A0A0E9PUV1_ANGAN